MKIRLITALILLLILALALATYGTLAFDIIVAGICIFAMWEIYSAAKLEKSLYIYIVFAVLSLVVLLGLNYLNGIVLAFLAYAFIVFVALCIMRFSATNSLGKFMLVFLLNVIVFVCFYSVLSTKHYFLQNNYGYDALYFVLIALNCAWGADSAAYFSGRYLGKRKLSPTISPNKTVEGAIGGIIGSVALGQVVTVIYILIAGDLMGLGFETLRPRFYISIAVICAVGAVLGIIGDLFASCVKRVCGVKDYGSIFPGHGGLMDRFDSVTFTMPFVTLSSIVIVTSII